MPATPIRSAEANLALARAGVAQAAATRGAARESWAANEALIAGSTIDTNPEVAAAKAKLQQARLDLERTVIRAPIDGVVTNRQVQVGQRVSAGSPVMTSSRSGRSMSTPTSRKASCEGPAGSEGRARPTSTAETWSTTAA